MTLKKSSKCGSGSGNTLCGAVASPELHVVSKQGNTQWVRNEWTRAQKMRLQSVRRWNICSGEDHLNVFKVSSFAPQAKYSVILLNISTYYKNVTYSCDLNHFHHLSHAKTSWHLRIRLLIIHTDESKDHSCKLFKYLRQWCVDPHTCILNNRSVSKLCSCFRASDDLLNPQFRTCVVPVWISLIRLVNQISL